MSLSTRRLQRSAPSIHSGGVSYTATMLPAQDTGYVGNSGRGEYLWYPSDHPNPVPTSLDWEVRDIYARVIWREIEPEYHAYNWSVIENYLTQAAHRGGRFGFRVMPFHQGVANSLPSDVAALASTRTINLDGVTSYLPDWNDTAYLGRWKELMTAIAARYDNDPRLYSIDVGGYGNWGEGHNHPYENQYPGPNGQIEGTATSLQTLIRTACDAFKNTFVYYNPMTLVGSDSSATIEGSAGLLQYALNYSKRVGIRTDSFGGGNIQWMANAIINTAQLRALAAEVSYQDQPLGRWQIAPSTAEWSGYVKPLSVDASTIEGSFAEGADQAMRWHTSLISNANFYDDNNGYTSFSASEKAAFDLAMQRAGFTLSITDATCSVAGTSVAVSATWTNSTYAPTYDSWTITYQLRQNGIEIASVDSSFDVRMLYSNGSRHVDTVTINAPATLTGREVISVIVRPANNYLGPMQLACGTRLTDGSHQIGTLSDRAALPPYTPPSAHGVILFEDTFTTPLYKWAHDSASIWSNNRLVLATSQSYPSSFSYARFDIREAILTAHISQPLPATGSYESSLQVICDEANKIILNRTAGGMAAIVITNGVKSTYTLPGYTLAHTWWRIRETNNTFYFEFSTNGTNWNTFGQATHSWSVQFVFVLLQAGNWAAEAPATMAVDSVQVVSL